MSDFNLQAVRHSAPLRAPFTISRGVKTAAETVRVVINAGDAAGRGEGVPYARYGESVESVLAQIEAVRSQIESGASRADLIDLMAAGAARCAVDCALWDLEAKQMGTPVWERAGLPRPQPVATATTISLDTPEAMAAAAKAVEGRILKIKLGDDGALERVEAVRAARPEAKIIVDANEAANPRELDVFAAAARALDVALIEQPLPAGEDQALAKHALPVAICADESAHTAADIEHLVKLYDVVNVKLDKTGGLTAALDMVHAARRAGMGVMVGCMVAGSLSMAPAVLLAQLADVADLDGPLWLAEDVENGLNYSDGAVAPPTPALWG